VITKADLIKYDRSQMCNVYNQWPKIAKDAYNLKIEQVNFKDINHLVFSGMGGSGTIGDMFASILSKSEIPVSIVKGFHLPSTINNKTLVIATSVSGNTLETITTLKEANRRKSKIIAFSSGGKIEKYCKNNKIEYRKLKQNHSPRGSFMNYFYSILNTLQPILPVKKNEITQSIKKIELLSKNISTNNLTKNNQAINLAEWVTQIPITYYPHGLKAAAIRFKNSLQENSKSHAITENIVEMCHNGIIAWEQDKKIQPILIEGKNDYIKTKLLQKIIKEYFVNNSIDFRTISSPSGSIVTKLVYLIYLLDFVSIYKSIINKTDPTPVESIKYLKSKFL
jgi:glucose/mannose-6-phosphate isomerase